MIRGRSQSNVYKTQTMMMRKSKGVSYRLLVARGTIFLERGSRRTGGKRMRNSALKSRE